MRSWRDALTSQRPSPRRIPAPEDCPFSRARESDPEAAKAVWTELCRELSALRVDADEYWRDVHVRYWIRRMVRMASVVVALPTAVGFVVTDQAYSQWMCGVAAAGLIVQAFAEFSRERTYFSFALKLDELTADYLAKWSESQTLDDLKKLLVQLSRENAKRRGEMYRGVDSLHEKDFSVDAGGKP